MYHTCWCLRWCWWWWWW